MFVAFCFRTKSLPNLLVQLHVVLAIRGLLDVAAEGAVALDVGGLGEKNAEDGVGKCDRVVVFVGGDGEVEDVFAGFERLEFGQEILDVCPAVLLVDDRKGRIVAESVFVRGHSGRNGLAGGGACHGFGDFRGTGHGGRGLVEAPFDGADDGVVLRAVDAELGGGVVFSDVVQNSVANCINLILHVVHVSQV